MKKITLLFYMAVFAFIQPCFANSLYSNLPEIAQVQRVALRYAGFESRHVKKWRKNAKLAALLPRIQFDYYRRSNSDRDINIEDNIYVGSNGVVVGPEENSFSEDQFSDQRYGVRAIWSFDRLIFSKEQLQISVEARSLAQARRELLTEVNSYYFRYKSALKNPKQKPEREQLAAMLSALTGGWFSRYIGEVK